MLIHGEKDQIILIDESRRATMTFPDFTKLISINEDHYLEKELELFIKHSLDWFRRTLK